ncbi:MAG TPA: response regulator [Nitrospirae bacterium]|nr:response regulator ArlR [bacterium BMS3Abin10]GBE39823.1 response regulator ArlR [bacterium BMS3Bbin08]HDH49981.1 response regulator [Nitrospirota bacterium]HDO25185.1 response regulator [Nitrospirota bacterium]
MFAFVWPENKQACGETIKGNSILVVDDVEIVFAAFRGELEKEGYEVDTALSGKKALEKVRSKKYDLIFMDLFMPGMDGVQTCRAIKQASPDSIIVSVTGQIYTGLADKELDFINAGGAVHFLYKPFLEGEILKVTRKVLPQRN